MASKMAEADYEGLKWPPRQVYKAIKAVTCMRFHALNISSPHLMFVVLPKMVFSAS